MDGIYAIEGSREQFIGRSPKGGVLMNVLRPGDFYKCSTEGCAPGFGVWVKDNLTEWEEEMKTTDADMPRWAEDIWDVIGVQNAPAAVQDKYNLKKEVRGRKPL